MKRARHGLSLLVAVAAIAAGAHAALAGAATELTSLLDDAGIGPGNSEDGGTEIDAAVDAPAPQVSLSGGASGSLAAAGEGRTTWRYGRSKGGATLDETTSRVRVSGAGRTFDGLTLTFSVAILVPAPRIGTYGAGGSLESVAGAWGRRDLGNATPEIEWEATARDGGAGAFVLTVTSLDETSHTSERRGGITADVTDYRAHGTLEATLPCVRSVASLRQSCRTETIRGTF